MFSADIRLSLPDKILLIGTIFSGAKICKKNIIYSQMLKNVILRLLQFSIHLLHPLIIKQIQNRTVSRFIININNHCTQSTKVT